MADGAANAMAQMPPWGWGLLLLGSGGGIGTLTGFSMEDHENCAERSDLVRAEAEVSAAQTALQSTSASMDSLIKVLKDCKSSPWVE